VVLLRYMGRMNRWQTKHERIVYQNPWIKVREDDVVFPNGDEGIYGVVTMADTVAVAARRDHSFCLVRQYRYTVGKDSWEFPSGHIRADETPLGAAKRELQEEAGLEASCWTDLGFVHPALGILNTTRHFFLAEDLRDVQTGHEASEQDMLVSWFPLRVIKKMIRENHLFDDYVLAVLYKLNIREFPD